MFRLRKSCTIFALLDPCSVSVCGRHPLPLPLISESRVNKPALDKVVDGGLTRGKCMKEENSILGALPHAQIEVHLQNVPSPLASPSSIPATSPAAAAPPPAVPTEDLVVAPAAPRRKSLRLPKGMRAMGPPTPPDAVRGGEAGGAGEGTAGGVGPAGVGVRVAGGAESECTMIPDSSDESDSESISESISGSDEVRGIGRGMPSDIIFAASGGSAETGEEVRQPGGRGTVGSKSGSEEEAGQRDWPAQQ